MALSADETIQLEKLKLKSREGGGAKKKKSLSRSDFEGQTLKSGLLSIPPLTKSKQFPKDFSLLFFFFFLISQ